MSDFSKYFPDDYPKSRPNNCPKNCPEQWPKNRADDWSVDWPKYCPPTCPADDMKRFVGFSNLIVTNYMNRSTHRPQGDVERDFAKLRNHLTSLRDDVRSEIYNRECRDVGGDEFVAGRLKFGFALEILERLVQPKFKRPVRHDAMDRAELIKFAIANFQSFGGELPNEVQNDFVGYLEALAHAAGILAFDGPKALEDFVKRRI